MPTCVLLSIKPVFVDRIFSGQKRYEFRKALFRNSDIERIIVYASSPISRVVGEFQVDGILRSDPASLWHKTSSSAGISKEYFDLYFGDRSIGYAIKIGQVWRYEHPLELGKHFSIKKAPQSFAYVTNLPTNRLAFN